MDNKRMEKNSTAGKSNRAAKSDAMIHIGGSRSFRQHLKKMVFLLSTFDNNIVNYYIIYNWAKT